jgi:hypothetical protein
MSVYNGALYLNETIDSIIAQKGIDFEFIIVMENDFLSVALGRIGEPSARK